MSVLQEVEGMTEFICPHCHRKSTVSFSTIREDGKLRTYMVTEHESWCPLSGHPPSVNSLEQEARA